MTDDKKVQKLVEAITLVKLAKKLNQEALSALIQGFTVEGDYYDVLEAGNQRIAFLRSSDQAEQAMDCICNAIQSALDAEDAKRESNRQAWADAANGMRKPPFAEGGGN